jgi:endoglucanase
MEGLMKSVKRKKAITISLRFTLSLKLLSLTGKLLADFCKERSLSGARCAVAALYVAIASTSLFPIMACAQSSEDTEAFASNRLLGRGINFGNALEAPHEGAWGITLKEQYFQVIKAAGFNSVRIPINWSGHAQSQPPYQIDPAFFDRIDWAIDQVLSRSLSAVIDIHHYAQMDQDPITNAPRLLSLWKQIAARYKHRPKTLLFDLFNEPQDKFTDEIWNGVFPELLQTIRQDDPNRLVIVGPGYWNSMDHLPLLQLPKDDRRLIVTFHYYKPFHFTHQAQDWMPMSMAWKGTGWGTQEDRDELHEDFAKAAAWATRFQRPLYLGEFGVSEAADPRARASWARAVAREAEQQGFSWAYWQFVSNFGVYNTVKESWDPQMLQALMDKD